MKAIYQVLILGLLIIAAASCTPNRGCTEMTADNYDPEAEQDDGTCIPARNKLIGAYTYTRIWTDVMSEQDMMDFGTMQITEANTANNAFVSNFNGNFFMFGNVTANDLLFQTISAETYSYTGTGTWLTADSVDLVLNITYNDLILQIPQPYTYYCTKQ